MLLAERPRALKTNLHLVRTSNKVVYPCPESTGQPCSAATTGKELPMDSFMQDIRYAVRMLLHAPGPTTIAVLTLALGIGANTGIFSLVDAVLLRPLPYPEPGQLVRVFTVQPTQPHFPVAVADFYDFRQRVSAFSSSALYAERDLDLTLSDRPEHLSGMAVTHEYFRVLGYHPVLGRDFDENEEYKNNNHVVIL